MDKESLINKIKDSCMVIGLRQKGQQYPEEIHGTGFTIDPEGFVVTADHVIHGLVQRLKELNAEDEKYELTASFIQHKSEKIFSLITTPIKEHRSIIITIDDLKGYLPQDHDVCICRIFGKWGNLPFLQLKKPTRLKVYQDIFICGYPRGSGTLNILDKKYGLRSSPLIQTGKISSLMPSDKTNKPTGLITDVIGVGGSSGSPIVDTNDGEVIGISQHIVPATVVDKLLTPIGTANIGLVWGVSTYFLYDTIHWIIEAMKKIINEQGEPIVPKDYVIKINRKVGEGSFPDLQPSKTDENLQV